MMILSSKEEVTTSSKWCKRSSVTLTFLLLILATTTNFAEAWSLHAIPTRRQQHQQQHQQQQQQQQQQCNYRTRTQLQQHTSSRRNFMTIATTALIVVAPNVATTAAAIAEDINPDKERFIACRKDLRELIDNYSDITSKGGGDAVRNTLGTQGVNSNMFGIEKLLKSLKFEAEDIVEYVETMEDFNAYYYQADGAAYQSMFVEHSSARSTKESCLITAKGDLLQMDKLLNQLAVQLNL